MKFFRSILPLAIYCFLFIGCNRSTPSEVATSTVPKIREAWTKEQSNEWYAARDWMRGCNFIPSTAINQLEMWQKETFDTATINRELGYAEAIGMNSMRVYLHHVAWKTDPEGFKKRMEDYLSIADEHNISTLFVFFDDCWNPTYNAGEQPTPKPGVHNSGWLRDPGDLLYEDTTLIVLLEKYVKDVLTHFKDDDRIVLWDLYNEPGNNNLKNKSMPLLEKVFQWGREINPAQPLSVGVWNRDLVELNKYQLENSDVITYHNYMDPVNHQQWIDSLQTYGRPLICTEYMARTRNSTFANILPMLKAENIGAYNWGLVAGKTNTIYAWDTPMPDGSEPKVWFHDIFRKDGTPYSRAEIELISSITGKGNERGN
ncbi:MAG TPA: cellulase family glycosylhydrolase [Ohtaekwangia sp.]|nr:cellulase family glycosylhydrolase [Ohtaekwangia sp.]